MMFIVSHFSDDQTTDVRYNDYIVLDGLDRDERQRMMCCCLLAGAAAAGRGGVRVLVIDARSAQ